MKAMNYVSTKTVESKTHEGVRFVLRRMTERRRQALHEMQADAAGRMKPLMVEFLPLDREYGEALKASREAGAAARKTAVEGGATEEEALDQIPNPPLDFADEKFRRWAELRAAIRKIEREEMEPAAIRFVVRVVEGYELDGAAVSDGAGLVETDGVADELLLEVSVAVQRELGLLPAEIENLSSRSTSAAAAGGAGTSGAADPAGTTATTTAGAAGSSTGPESASVPSTGSTP